MTPEMSTNLHNCKILVIGGCGYMGSRLVEWLIQESSVPASQVHVLDIVNPRPDGKTPDVHYLQADITNKSQVAQIFADTKPQVVIHTASPSPWHTSLDFYMRNNVDGTHNLLSAAVAQETVQIFVYTSSASVIHDSGGDLFEGDESYPLRFIPDQSQIYSHSKAIAEQTVLTFNRKRANFVVAAIRPASMFGPHDRTTTGAIVERAMKGGLRYQIGGGTNMTDFTYVDNVIHAHILAVQALLRALKDGPQAVPDDMRVEGEAFTVTNDEHYSFWGFARKLGEIAGHPTDADRIIVIPKAVGLNIASTMEWMVWLFTFGTQTSKIRRSDLKYSIITRTFDITKAKTRLGYRPRFSLEEGMKLAATSFAKDKKVD